MYSEDNKGNSDTSRKLAAILFADIVGYSKMMHADEKLAIEMLDHYKSALEEEVSSFGGHIVKNYGDGSLCIFQSVVQALRCAKSLQFKLIKSQKVPIRIGIHTGDVIEKNNDIYGDGVNIAARLESIGQAGTVLFSKSVYDKVRNHKEFQFSSYGRVSVKNIKEPVFVYGLANEGLKVLKIKELETPFSKPLDSKSSLVLKKIYPYIIILLGILGTKFWSDITQRVSIADKSIAVLPFHNDSQDPSNEYFCNGIMEDLLTQLQKTGDLKVISRSSVMAYKNSSKPIREIAKELKVAFVLEGSVRKADNQVLVTAQLIDGKSESQVWADRYNEKLTAKNIFDIQGNIARNITNNLEAEMTDEEGDKGEYMPTNNLVAYDNYLRGMYFYNDRFSKGEEYTLNAIRMFQNAVDLDSTFALAHLRLGFAHDHMFWTNIDGSNERAEMAKKHYDKAQQLDPRNPDIIEGQGWFQYHINANFDEAKNIFSSIIKKYPKRYSTLNALGVINSRLGNWQEAEENFEESINLDPSYASTHLNFYYNLVGQRKFIRAKNYLDNLLNISPANSTAHREMTFLILYTTGDVARALEYYNNSGLNDPDHLRLLLVLDRAYDQILETEPEITKDTDIELLTDYAMANYFNTDLPRARIFAQNAILNLEQYIENSPKDYRKMLKLGLMYALTNNENKAMAILERVSKERSIKKDALMGPQLAYEQARILKMLGKNTEAINILKQLMGIPCNLTVEILKIGPMWDDVRDDDEFKKILAFQTEVESTQQNL